MSGSGRLRRVGSVRCCGRKAFTGLSAARGRRGLAAAVAYVGGLEEVVKGPPVKVVFLYSRLTLHPVVVLFQCLKSMGGGWE